MRASQQASSLERSCFSKVPRADFLQWWSVILKYPPNKPSLWSVLYHNIEMILGHYASHLIFYLAPSSIGIQSKQIVIHITPAWGSSKANALERGHTVSGCIIIYSVHWHLELPSLAEVSLDGHFPSDFWLHRMNTLDTGIFLLRFS